jgi:hypothetical protein
MISCGGGRGLGRLLTLDVVAHFNGALQCLKLQKPSCESGSELRLFSIEGVPCVVGTLSRQRELPSLPSHDKNAVLEMLQLDPCIFEGQK